MPPPLKTPVFVPIYDSASDTYATFQVHNRKTKLKFEGGHMLIGFDVYKSLTHYRSPTGQRMPRDAYDVYFWLLQNVRFRNIVGRHTYQRIANETGISGGRSRVGKMIGMLEQANCVQRCESEMRLNPNHCFWGHATDHLQAKAEWAREHMRVVAKRQA